MAPPRGETHGRCGSESTDVRAVGLLSGWSGEERVRSSGSVEEVSGVGVDWRSRILELLE